MKPHLSSRTDRALKMYKKSLRHSELIPLDVHLFVEGALDDSVCLDAVVG